MSFSKWSVPFHKALQVRLLYGDWLMFGFMLITRNEVTGEEGELYNTKCQMDSFMYSMSMPGAPPNNLSAGVGSQTEFVQTARREYQFLPSNFSDSTWLPTIYCKYSILTPFFFDFDQA